MGCSESLSARRRKQVRQKLGSASQIDRPGVIWYYRRRQLAVTFGGSRLRVLALSTTNRSQRTAQGVGVGSSEQDVKRLVPGVRCGAPVNAGTDCVVFCRTATLRIAGVSLGTDTDFLIRTNGLVGNVSIGVYRADGLSDRGGHGT
jgi:hypothetical protein